MEAFRKVDVFVCPTLPFTATPVGATTVVIDNEVEEDMLSAIMQFTGIASLTGLPALSVPCGFDEDGLPIGMQLIGRPFDEATLFSMGHAYQGSTDFHTRAPSRLARARGRRASGCREHLLDGGTQAQDATVLTTCPGDH